MPPHVTVMTSSSAGLAEGIAESLGQSLLLIAHDPAPSGEGEVEVQVIEPFTWAWLGLKLVEGVVAWVGGKVFQQAFFPDVSNSQVVEALSRKIDEAVQILQQYIDARIDAETVDVAQRRLFSVYTLLREYANAPTGDPGRLSNVNATATELWNILYSRGQAAFIPACLAASLKVAALWTRYSESKHPGDRINVIEFLDLAIGSISKWKELIYNHNHVFELTPVAIDGECHDDGQGGASGRGGGGVKPFIENSRGHGLLQMECTAWARFRANGQEFKYWGGGTTGDAARNRASAQAYTAYNVWNNRKVVVEPYVRENLILPAEYIVTKLTECRSSVR